MATYKPLKVLFRETTANAEATVNKELTKRLESPATVTYPYYVGNFALFAVLHREIYELSEAVWATENLIQNAWNTLPSAAQNYYFSTLLVEEIQSTNEIENIQSTRREVADALNAAVQNSDAEPPKRFQEMASTFRLLFESDDSGSIEFPQTLEDVRALYDQLLGAEIVDDDRVDGDLFRLKDVFVSDGSKSIHRGVRGEDEIKSRLGIMLDSRGDQKQPALVNAFASHFMLEHTHPFYDGNGRFGRFLLALSLQMILSAPTALSLSAEVMRQKRKYYKAFLQVEDPMNKGEITFFVLDMLVMLLAAQMGLLDSLRNRLQNLDDLSKRMAAIRKKPKGLTDYQLGILFMLGQVLLFGPRSGETLEEISKFLNRSKNTVRPELKDLTERGLLREVTKRPLVFSLTAKGRELLDLQEPESF